MKGLAAVGLVVWLVSAAAIAGPLEMTIGAGPQAASLQEINSAIGVVNALVVLLNETFVVHPGVEGTVGQMPPMSSGFGFSAAERYFLTNWFAVGAQLDYGSYESSLTGQYQGSALSTIDVALGLKTLGILIGGRATFVDVGLLLGAQAGVGYYYTALDSAVVFEVPVEYPEAISRVPPEGAARYTAGTFGFEVGLSLSYPLTSWLTIGSVVTYRSASANNLADAQGNGLDLDGDGVSESIDLSGISVQFMFSLNIDLSFDERKE